MAQFNRFLKPTFLLRAAKAPGKAISRQVRTMRRGLLRSVLPKQLRSGPGARMLRMLGRRGAAEKPPETIEAPGLEPATKPSPEEVAEGGQQPRLPGPPTIVERRMRLDPFLARQVGEVGRVAYRANTIAIVDRGNKCMRLLHKIKNALLVIPALLASFLQIGSGAGRGRLGKQVVVIDRKGDITVYDV